MDNKRNLNAVVLQAKIPAHIGRRDSVSTTMTVLLTNAGNIQYHPIACTIPEQDYNTKAEDSAPNNLGSVHLLSHFTKVKCDSWT